MTRHDLRDASFRILFQLPFYPEGEMTEQEEAFLRTLSREPEQFLSKEYMDRLQAEREEFIARRNAGQSYNASFADENDTESPEGTGGPAQTASLETLDAEFLNRAASVSAGKTDTAQRIEEKVQEGIREEAREAYPAVSEADMTYIRNKVQGVCQNLKDIDAALRKNSRGWEISRLGKAELAILRLAVYEMRYDDDIPVKVAMDEAIELSKTYCDEKAPAFVNGVLSGILDEAEKT